MLHNSILLAVILLSLTCGAMAVEGEESAAKPFPVKVLKTKNGRAVIKHAKKRVLQKKKIYYLSEEPPNNDSDKEIADILREEAAVSRKWVVGADIDINLASRDSGQNAQGETEEFKQFDLQILFGYNRERIEVGILAENEFTTIGQLDTSSLLGGIFFDYNFKRNEIENSFVYGIRVIGAGGNQDRSDYTAAGTLVRGSGSLFIKWFGLATTTALVLQAGYQIDNVAFESFDVRTSGSLVKLGVQAYF